MRYSCGINYNWTIARYDDSRRTYRANVYGALFGSRKKRKYNSYEIDNATAFASRKRDSVGEIFVIRHVCVRTQRNDDFPRALGSFRLSSIDGTHLCPEIALPQAAPERPFCELRRPSQVAPRRRPELAVTVLFVSVRRRIPTPKEFRLYRGRPCVGGPVMRVYYHNE